MSGVNKVILIGHLGADPERRFTNSGMAVTNFRMATTENWGKKDGEREERTEWHRIVTFGKLAEICGEYLSKGKQVYIEGRIQTRDWEDRDGNKRWTTEIVASQMVMLGRAGEGGSTSRQNGPPPSGPPSGGGGGGSGGASGGGRDYPPDDDVPF